MCIGSFQRKTVFTYETPKIRKTYEEFMHNRNKYITKVSQVKIHKRDLT